MSASTSGLNEAEVGLLEGIAGLCVFIRESGSSLTAKESEELQ